LSNLSPIVKYVTTSFASLNKKFDLEICVGVQHFLSQAFEYFYIVIWLCMSLEDVLEILPLLMPKTFINQFVFVWGHGQCIGTTS
jgi:hypothetical protein